MTPDSRFSRRRNGRFLFFIPVIIAVAALLSGAVMLLWNALLPALFGFVKINFLQSAGLLLLCRILFGNFGGKGGKPGGPMGGMGRMKEKWMGMGVEDRQKFREEWKKRCER